LREPRAAAVNSARIAVAALAFAAAVPPADAAPGCRGHVYLTLDTGNMRDAELIAGILRKHQVRATFFLASERTPRGDRSLDASWGEYWRARVAEGHAFGNHTFDHVYFRGASGDGQLTVRPEFGDRAGRTLRWSAADVCAELERVDARFRELTGRPLDRWWRAPGGKAPPEAMQAARDCGYAHVHWAPAGFLGDELPSDKFPNDRLLKDALAKIRAGDILMAHLGIWSRADPYAPMLDPLIAGLKSRGLCFATLREHPDYRR
ncbi:MAG TPA: polysaccharide deacetylase family protein, partial [Burkholderiaceae bacterium]|nr:polysaccharide deacetylase family protein [Burkholderiaceae bacterium]